MKLLKSTVPKLTNKKERLDLTDLYVFTIDDGKSKRLDDALSIEACSTHPDCWKVSQAELVF